MMGKKVICALAVGLVGMTGCGPSESASAEIGDRALKSCLGPDFDPAEDIGFVSLDAPTYPAAQKKADQLANKDYASAGTNADSPLTQTVINVVESKFFLLPMSSLLLPAVTAACNHDIYAQNRCEGMSMVFGGKATLDDVEMNEGQLSYVIRAHEKDEVTRVMIADRDYNDVSISVDKGKETVNYEITRDANGTEHFDSESSSGDTIRFLERPDCSGTYAQRDTTNGSVERTVEFEWTSAKKAQMNVQWTACRYTNGKKCDSGKF